MNKDLKVVENIHLVSTSRNKPDWLGLFNRLENEHCVHFSNEEQSKIKTLALEHRPLLNSKLGAGWLSLHRDFGVYVSNKDTLTGDLVEELNIVQGLNNRLQCLIKRTDEPLPNKLMIHI